MSAWVYLILAGTLEVGFASMLKLSDGFTRLIPTLMFVFFAITSFYALTKAIETIPMGTAYAVWTGFLRLFFLFTLVASIIGLKLFAN